jgi:hypothetical protein
MSLSKKTACISAAAISILSTGWAGAHVSLTDPPPRLAGDAGGTQLKVAPCGQNQNGRTDTVTEFLPGETITVAWDEYINHPSYYRISFDVDGDDDFPIRADMDSVDPDTDDPESVNPVGDVVLAYVHEDPDMGNYSVEVTLPNVQCENCTLQLIQFMYDKVGNNSDDEYYFQCADIALRGDVLGSGGGSGSGGTTSGGGSGGDVSGGASSTGGDGSGGTTATGGGASGGASTGGGTSTGGAMSTGGQATASGGALATGGTPEATGGGVATTGGTQAAGGSVLSTGGGSSDGAVPPGMQEMGGCSLDPRGGSSGVGYGLLLLLGLSLFPRRRPGRTGRWARR